MSFEHAFGDSADRGYRRTDGGSTRFTQNFEAEVGGFFRLAEPLVGRAIRRQIEADMATLKDLLEAGERKARRRGRRRPPTCFARAA